MPQWLPSVFVAVLVLAHSSFVLVFPAYEEASGAMPPPAACQEGLGDLPPDAHRAADFPFDRPWQHSKEVARIPTTARKGAIGSQATVGNARLTIHTMHLKLDSSQAES